MAGRPRLIVHTRALALSVRVFRATAALGRVPGESYYQAQLRSAVAAIAANIAEGQGQETAAQFARCLSIAIASAHEAESHVEEMKALRMLQPEVSADIQDELRITRAMTIALRTFLRKKSRADRGRRRS